MTFTGPAVSAVSRRILVATVPTVTGVRFFRPLPPIPRDVWGYLSIGQTRTVDAHACRLRKKLKGSDRPWVVNVRGVGYRLTQAL